MYFLHVKVNITKLTTALKNLISQSITWISKYPVVPIGPDKWWYCIDMPQQYLFSFLSIYILPSLLFCIMLKVFVCIFTTGFQSLYYIIINSNKRRYSTIFWTLILDNFIYKEVRLSHDVQYSNLTFEACFAYNKSSDAQDYLNEFWLVHWNLRLNIQQSLNSHIS